VQFRGILSRDRIFRWTLKFPGVLPALDLTGEGGMFFDDTMIPSLLSFSSPLVLRIRGPLSFGWRGSLFFFPPVPVPYAVPHSSHPCPRGLNPSLAPRSSRLSHAPPPFPLDEPFFFSPSANCSCSSLREATSCSDYNFLNCRLRSIRRFFSGSSWTAFGICGRFVPWSSSKAASFLWPGVVQAGFQLVRRWGMFWPLSHTLNCLFPPFFRCAMTLPLGLKVHLLRRQDEQAGMPVRFFLTSELLFFSYPSLSFFFATHAPPSPFCHPWGWKVFRVPVHQEGRGLGPGVFFFTELPFALFFSLFLSPFFFFYARLARVRSRTCSHDIIDQFFGAPV